MLVKLFSVEHLMTIWSFLGRHLVTEKRMRSLKQAGRLLVGITRNKTWRVTGEQIQDAARPVATTMERSLIWHKRWSLHDPEACTRLWTDKLVLERSTRGHGTGLWEAIRGLCIRQTMFPALAYYWVFWAGGTKSDGSDFDRWALLGSEPHRR